MDKQSPTRPGWHLTNAAWHFVVRADTGEDHAPLRWSWRVVAANGVTWIGDEGFATLPLCQADAAEHGFVQTQLDPRGHVARAADSNRL